MLERDFNDQRRKSIIEMNIQGREGVLMAALSSAKPTPHPSLPLVRGEGVKDQMLPPADIVNPTSTILGTTSSPRSLASRRSAEICPILSRGVSTLASGGSIACPMLCP